MVDMQGDRRRQDREYRASITCMIRHYVARRAQVTEGHPHNAAYSARQVRQDHATAAGMFASIDGRLAQAMTPVSHDVLSRLE
jgi:hypothetical protein